MKSKNENEDHSPESFGPAQSVETFLVIKKLLIFYWSDYRVKSRAVG